MGAILADNIFKWIFLNENGRILIKIWLKYVPQSWASIGSDID